MPLLSKSLSIAGQTQKSLSTWGIVWAVVAYVIILLTLIRAQTAFIFAFPAFLGGIAALFSFCGLGLLVQWLVRCKTGFPLSTSAAIGLAATAFILSILSLLHAITLASVLVLQVVGLIALAINGPLVVRRVQAVVRLPHTLILIAVLALIYLRSVNCVAFIGSDDVAGYLPMIEKIVQTGGLGRDPFLVYRLQAGMGAYLYLQSAFAIQFGYYHLSLLNPALGIIIAVYATIEFASGKVSPRGIVGIGLVTAAALAVPDPNFTPQALLAAAVLVLLFELCSGRLRGLPEALCLGLIVGLILSLKITILPLLIIAAAAWLLLASPDLSLFKRLALAAGAGASCIIVMLPGMLSLHVSAGTYLFPLLGTGHYGSTYGTVAYPSDGVTITKIAKAYFLGKKGFLAIPATALLSAAVAVSYFRKHSHQPLDAYVLVLALAVWPLLLLTAYAVGGESNALRYALPMFVPADLIATVWLAAALANKNIELISNPWPRRVAVLALGIFFSLWSSSFIRQSVLNLAFLGTGNPVRALELQQEYTQSGSEALTNQSDHDSLENAQQAIPQGKVVLTYLQRVDGLDFRRNEIFTTGSFPGAMAPPGGMPLDGSGAEIKRYLRSTGVAYVIFQYAGSLPIYDGNVRAVAAHVFVESPWDDTFAVAAAKGRPMFLRLMAESRIIYKDERFVALEVI